MSHRAFEGVTWRRRLWGVVGNADFATLNGAIWQVRYVIFQGKANGGRSVVGGSTRRDEPRPTSGSCVTQFGRKTGEAGIGYPLCRPRCVSDLAASTAAASRSIATEEDVRDRTGDPRQQN